MLPHAWVFQSHWEDFFTVVHWEQRGAGKNHQSAMTGMSADPLTFTQLVSDAEELVAHLRLLLDKERIVLLGYSSGSLLGVALAHRHPDWFHAYVGAGQAVRGDDEQELFDRLIERVRAAGDRTALAELAELAPHPHPAGRREPKATLALRRIAARNQGGWYGWTTMQLYYSLPGLSPDYSIEDVAGWLPAGERVNLALSEEISAIDLFGWKRRFDLPVVFLMGRYDLCTPYTSAFSYFEWLDAPRKRFIPFERSSHFPMLEQPGLFLQALVREVLPLTEGCADFTVDPGLGQSANVPTPR